MAEMWNYFEALSAIIKEPIPSKNKIKFAGLEIPDAINNAVGFEDNDAESATAPSTAAYCSTSGGCSNSVNNSDNAMTISAEVSSEAHPYDSNVPYDDGRSLPQPAAHKRKTAAVDNGQLTSAGRRTYKRPNTGTGTATQCNSCASPPPQPPQDDSYQFMMSLLPYLRDVPKYRRMIVRQKLQKVFVDEQERQTSLNHSSCATTTVYQTPVPSTRPPPPPYVYDHNFVFVSPQPPKSDVDRRQNNSRLDYSAAVNNEPGRSYGQQKSAAAAAAVTATATVNDQTAPLSQTIGRLRVQSS